MKDKLHKRYFAREKTLIISSYNQIFLNLVKWEQDKHPLNRPALTAKQFTF